KRQYPDEFVPTHYCSSFIAHCLLLIVHRDTAGRVPDRAVYRWQWAPHFRRAPPEWKRRFPARAIVPAFPFLPMAWEAASPFVAANRPDKRKRQCDAAAQKYF